ncbi:hypothetical protein CHARACLAT_009612 [Characodon lateralis]|uniref:Uncharacterized protein n=1 Tax=Characodon lateralis TaxID=208331 RepID=A0ABU7DRB7_9TELE|nr:hypothetical protein [Characodon lateralis]
MRRHLIPAHISLPEAAPGCMGPSAEMDLGACLQRALESRSGETGVLHSPVMRLLEYLSRRQPACQCSSVSLQCIPC